MKLTYASTTTTTISQTAYSIFCDPNTSGGFLYVVAGRPTFGANTASKNAVATANVTCLNVVNNTAAIGGHVTKFSGDFPPTAGLLFNGTDNTVARQQVAPDLFDGAFVDQAPQVCPAPSGGLPDHERRRLRRRN